ncbi:MAG: hypothetical protein UV73_C0005G0065 [Candidatus Gottesmanbacteria bacterium GW2011_GWA2_43_14]|uniref:Uncharacterized protein n=1 Tax=Candidatus Gottesmanbacteria bacterium GW2011_GWA2_43_14 TaxID=1618443 RepID=A0A0G1GG34_9BACT|nr:MAG: hypothetical protein UV73_C0005G0065 [Candidatus Gottesmanbacteria bacterium GW2011_GWA2_43_14]
MVSDITIFLIAVISTLSFVFFHLFFFRFIDKRKILKWLVRLFFLGIAVSISIFNFIVSGPVTYSKIEAQLIILMMYSLMSLAYSLAVFGITATSLRIRILTFINNNSQGVNLKQILKKYNRRVILRNRLERFSSSGELVKVNGKYRIRKKFSLFLLPASFFRLIFILYGRKPSY